MATFFGEVILPSSRAFFDDNDDSDNENEASDAPRNVLRANIKDTLEGVHPEIFIISDGNVAKDFVNNYLMEKRDVVAEFTVETNQTIHYETEMIYSKKMSTKPAVVATLFNLGKGRLYLESSKHLSLMDCNSLTLKVQSWLEKAKKIVIFASRPLSQYNCEKYDSMPRTFVRTLATPSSSLSSFQPLEQPNFISGFGASVMSWCKVKELECLLHICYTDALFSDSATLAPFLQCISNSPLGHLIHKNPPKQLIHNNPSHLNVMYQ